MFDSDTPSSTHFRRIALIALMAVLGYAMLAVTPTLVKAEVPGRGLTAQFEIDYLKFIINHHLSALRLTELAVGTDTVREADIAPDEGTSPSPDFAPTPAKATLEQITSLARRANRVQREEILEAQSFLRDWYGIDHQPSISPSSRERIELLEQAPAGDASNHLFLEVFSRHHYTALTRTLDCLVSAELRHTVLERYCRGILQSQLSEIDAMRHVLCDQYQICDYQPLTGTKGQHSGDESE